MIKIIACLLVVIPQLLLAQTNSSAVDSLSKKKKVFTVVEEMPKFVGGEQALMMYIINQIHYPAKARENGVSGRVYVSFIIDETGKVSETKVIRGIGSGCDEEALRVISGMPDWEPGRQNGQPVAVYYNLPINFNLVVPEKNKSEVKEDTSFLYNRGVKNLESKKYQDAQKFFGLSLMNHPFDKDALYNMGIARIFLSDTSGACWVWQTAKQYGDADASKAIQRYCGSYADVIRPDSLIMLNQISELQLSSNGTKIITPRFSRKEGELKRYFDGHLKDSKKGKGTKGSNKLTVAFIVKADGTLVDPVISKGASDGSEKKIIDAFLKMPKWIPGMIDFRPVNMRQELEVEY